MTARVSVCRECVVKALQLCESGGGVEADLEIYANHILGDLRALTSSHARAHATDTQTGWYVGMLSVSLGHWPGVSQVSGRLLAWRVPNTASQARPATGGERDRVGYQSGCFAFIHRLTAVAAVLWSRYSTQFDDIILRIPILCD